MSPEELADIDKRIGEAHLDNDLPIYDVAIDLRREVQDMTDEAVKLAEDLAAAIAELGALLDVGLLEARAPIAMGRLRHVERVLSGRPFEMKSE